VFTFTISDKNSDNRFFELSHVPLRPNYHPSTGCAPIIDKEINVEHVNSWNSNMTFTFLVDLK
jgi:hypothetical protein